MAELGYFGILILSEYGGLGLGAFEYCLVAEELARGWMSVVFADRTRQRADRVAEGHDAGAEGGLPAAHGEKGEFLGAFLPEPDAGSDGPTSPAVPGASATNGRSPVTNTGAPSLTARTSSWSLPGQTRRSTPRRGTRELPPS